jgi:hypothetical protein
VKERVVAWSSSQKSISARIKNRKKNEMNTKIKLAVMAGVLVMAAQAHASLEIFDISFTQAPPNNNAYGQIDVNMVNGLAVSGSLTVYGIPNPSSAAGTYNLIPDPGNVAGAYVSPSGAFIYDDQILGIPPGPPSNPYLDVYGLAFSKGSGLTYEEVNLWGNGVTVADEYTFYGYTAAGGFNPMVTGGAAISDAGPAPVPEPTTMISGALLLLPFGASTLRILRKNRAA